MVLKSAVIKKMAGFGLRPDDDSKFEYLSTGFIGADYMLYGGLPRGFITTLRGFSSFGKTTLSALICLNTVRSGGSAVMIDTEYTITRQWLRDLGDVDNLITLLKPDKGMSGEAITDGVIELVTNGEQDIIVYDSIKDTVFAAEMAGSMADQQMGLQSRMWGKFCRKVKLPLLRSNGVLLMTNKDRTMFDKYAPDIDYGGSEIGSFAPVARIGLLAPKKPKEGSGLPLVLRPLMVKYKNKASNRRCEINLFPNRSGDFIYDPVPELVGVAKNLKVFTFEDGSAIKGNGVWYFDGRRLASGEAQVLAMIGDDDALQGQVQCAVYERMYVTPSENLQNDNEFDAADGEQNAD